MPTYPVASEPSIVSTADDVNQRNGPGSQGGQEGAVPARMATYELAAAVTGDEDPAALALYAWNAQVSAALLAPLHICEVVIRNSVSDALEMVYGLCGPGLRASSRAFRLRELDIVRAKTCKMSAGFKLPPARSFPN